MSRFAARTEVPVEKTRAEIETTVRRYGADGFLSGWEDAKAMVQFRCAGRYVRFNMVLPHRDEERFTTYILGHATKYARKETEALKLWEQACRQRWRALLLLVKAKLEAVESGIVTFEEEFLAHVVLPDGQTVYERTKAPLAIAYETGDAQTFLPGPKS